MLGHKLKYFLKDAGCVLSAVRASKVRVNKRLFIFVSSHNNLHRYGLYIYIKEIFALFVAFGPIMMLDSFSGLGWVRRHLSRLIMK